MADVAPVVFKKRITKLTAARKRPATPPPAPSDSDSEVSSADEAGTRIKRRRKGDHSAGIVTVSTASRPAEELSKSIAFTGDRSTNFSSNDDATRTSNWFDADAADPTRIKAAEQKAASTASGYSGQSKYSDFIKKNPEAPAKSLGPVKGPTNVRTLTITDFAPDVCKDYKQTGFCGFGDSCKFLHAREDYKAGWQLDRDWEKAQKGGETSANGTSKPNKDGEVSKEIPFACIICTGPYKNPVVTKCGHYFCRECAMDRYRTKGGTKCAACKADTGGNFTMARNLTRMLERKKERTQEAEA